MISPTTLVGKMKIISASLLHYEEYVVDLDLSDYSEDEVIEIKAVHDSLNSAIPNLLKSGLLKEICTFLQPRTQIQNSCYSYNKRRKNEWIPR